MVPVDCCKEMLEKIRSLKDEVREGPPKTDVVPENIDDVHELIVM